MIIFQIFQGRVTFMIDNLVKKNVSDAQSKWPFDELILYIFLYLHGIYILFPMNLFLSSNVYVTHVSKFDKKGGDMEYLNSHK